MANSTSSAKAEDEAPSLRTVIVASSAGTAFEWYDFFIYGSLTALISSKFLSQLDPVSGVLAALAIFSIGFLFRPVGALAFGWMGDRIGRKVAFLMTVLMMGGATFAIGLIPTYDMIGPAAPIILIFLRILQGLAVGGEYGGAAIYVAEHSDAGRRGATTSWIQSSASFGLLGALAVILTLRLILGREAFDDWGWRVPFLLSAGLVAISVWMRMKLSESPEFKRMKAEGRVTRAPFKEAFLRWKNLRIVLIALVSLMFAQGAIWYCVFFYASTFLETLMKLDPVLNNIIMIGATAASIPLYVFFGGLSDKIGRKPVLLLGMGLGILAAIPAFQMMARGANPELMNAQQKRPVVVHADPATCHVQFDLLGGARYETGCDIVRTLLTRAGVGYTRADAPAGTPTTVTVGRAAPVASPEGVGLDAASLKSHVASIDTALKASLAAQGYPKTADPNNVNWVWVVFGMSILVLAATALYGPMAAALVELFPTNVRYTALSVPYHVGVGWVGGLMPMTAFAIATATGDIFAGLWYTVIFGAISLVCCIAIFPETRGRPLVDQAE